ncbi:hypothetical protein ANPL_03315 [Anaplasma platys]|uniref:Uncharacterized protein n=1 Tax=Anaplasma platys TaxID=949 RepID=A0A858PYP0_9RICK|nr:hypothetical protein [Anaplasma platys]QJC27721.1 hypothetical protein ANPL_03315 [Anaplasma platys]
MLLLEELVTTLNQELFFFPHTYLIASEGYALESLIDDSNEELWSGKFSPTGDITITCPAPNKISVFVKVKFPAWLGTTTGVESQLSYDVEVIDDEFISYQNIRTTFLFQGTNRRLFDKTCREFRKNPGRGHHFQLDPPNIFPEKEGLIMDAQLEGGAFTIQSMLSPVLKKVTLPSDIQQPSATISPEKPRSAWHTIEDLLGHIGRCIQNFYVAAKNLFCCWIAGKAKTLPQDYDDVANTVHKKSTERNTRVEASVNTNKPSALQQAADTAPALITADAQPDGHASSVNVGPAIEDNTASRNCELR